MTASDHHRMLRIADVCDRTGLARRTIYDMMRRGSFPAAVKVTDHASRWMEAEVEAWLEARIAARNEARAA